MSISTPSVRSFAYGIGCSLGDTVVAYTFTAARWGVLCWDFFTQPQAIQTYKWLGAMTVALGQLAYWSVVWFYTHIKQWAEREVQSHIQEPSVVPVEVMDIPAVSELLDDAAEVDPFDISVNPLDIPVVQDVIVSPLSTASIDTAGISSRDALRKEAKARKIPGYSRMAKAQLAEALGYV